MLRKQDTRLILNCNNCKLPICMAPLTPPQSSGRLTRHSIIAKTDKNRISVKAVVLGLTIVGHLKQIGL